MTIPSGGQTAYNFLMNVAPSAGLQYDIGFNDVISPVTAVNQIPFGVGVGKVIGADYQVQLPQQNIVAVQASTALVASNSTVVTLNGVALTPVVYATSNAATLTAIATLIAAQPNILSAVSNGTDTITITASPGYGVTATFVTTGGAGQPTWTSTYSDNVLFYGVSLFIQNKMNLLASNGYGSAGGPGYFAGDPVSVIQRGRVWVSPETTVTSDSPVYMRIKPNGSNTQLGAFRGDSDSSTCILISSTQVRWLLGNGSTQGGFAVLQINEIV